MVVIFSSEDKAIVMPVASIIATTQGRMPESIALTPEYLSKSFMIEAMMNIITSEGNTTPRVAINPPMKPACDEPTKVAMFTASGPGVDSDTAIKFTNSSSLSQPKVRTFSRIMDIIPYPPPNDTAPISRKMRKSLRYIILLYFSF